MSLFPKTDLVSLGLAGITLNPSYADFPPGDIDRNLSHLLPARAHWHEGLAQQGYCAFTSFGAKPTLSFRYLHNFFVHIGGIYLPSHTRRVIARKRLPHCSECVTEKPKYIVWRKQFDIWKMHICKA